MISPFETNIHRMYKTKKYKQQKQNKIDQYCCIVTKYGKLLNVE